MWVWRVRRSAASRLAVLAGGDELGDPHVRAEREQRQQQPSAQLLAGDVLACGDAS